MISHNTLLLPSYRSCIHDLVCDDLGCPPLAEALLAVAVTLGPPSPGTSASESSFIVEAATASRRVLLRYDGWLRWTGQSAISHAWPLCRMVKLRADAHLVLRCCCLLFLNHRALEDQEWLRQLSRRPMGPALLRQAARLFSLMASEIDGAAGRLE